jgi:hypothetical protein
MRSCDFFLRISANNRCRRGIVTGTSVRSAARVGGRWRRGRAVGFEDVEAFELLVQYGERLELLRLDHLLLEPVLDLILLFLDEVLVVIV